MNPDLVPLPTPEHAAPDAPQPTPFDTWRARFMFVLGFAYLLLMAGLLHRATTETVSVFELDVMSAGIAFLWPIFVGEAIWQVYQRDRAKLRGPFIWRTILVCVMPPWRMALADSRTGLIWIPRMGWVLPGKELFKRIELVFSGPMLLFAFLILPVLLLEYIKSDQVKSNAALALTLDIGISVIWVAFATEFVFKASAHPKPFKFAKERWLDVAIVVLPMLEFVLWKWADAAPLARLLRLGRAISPEQLARMQRLYRLQGLATKAWHALLLIESVARILGQTPEKRLTKLEARIAEMEEDLAELRREAEVVRGLIPPSATQSTEETTEEATEPAQKEPDTASGGRVGEPSSEAVIASNLPSGP